MRSRRPTKDRDEDRKKIKALTPRTTSSNEVKFPVLVTQPALNRVLLRTILFPTVHLPLNPLIHASRNLFESHLTFIEQLRKPPSLKPIPLIQYYVLL
jgi:hypothetical protein